MEFFQIADVIESAFVYDVYRKYLWVVLLCAGCCYAVLYIFKCIALYTIACREGYKNKWMAFLPFFNTYYIGVVSERNRVFRTKAKYISLGAALVELAFVALSTVAFTAKFIIFNGGYASPEYGTIVYFGMTIDVLNGYTPNNLPQGLGWAWWFAMDAQNFLLYGLQLAFLILYVFTIIAFFRTYSPSRYVVFSLLGVIFPLSGVFMFAVRNNRSVNYADFLREKQQRQYRLYQEYMRGNMTGMNSQGYGGYYGGNNGDPYNGQNANGGNGVGGNRNVPPDDPFGGLGANSSNLGGSSGDPFDEF